MKKMFQKLTAFLLALALMVTCLPAEKAEAYTFTDFYDGEYLTVLAPDGVNMHQLPDTTSTRITTLASGSEIEVLTILYSGWMRVTNGTHIGYVEANTNGWFSPKQAAATPSVYPYNNKQATVLASALNVHKTPYRLNNNILDDIYYGRVVNALGYTYNGWTKISYYRNGSLITGYVSSSYIKVTDKQATESPVPQTFNNIYGYSAIVKSSVNSGLNVHVSPTTTATVITDLYAGDAVTILAQSTSWYKISINVDNEMRTGYILRSYVNKYDAMVNLRLNKTTKTVKVKKKYHLIVRGNTGMSLKTTWKSNKKSVATVNKYGYVTAKKKGTAKITCTIKVGSRTKKLTCTIKVKK